MKGLIVATLTASIALVGCSGGTVSATSDQSQSSSTATNSILERIKGIFKSDSRAVTVQVPVQTVINETANEWLEERKIVFPREWYFGDICNNLPEILRAIGEPEIDLRKHFREAKERILLTPEQNRSEVDRLALQMNEAFQTHSPHSICARMQLVKAAQPIYGWQGFGDEKKYEQATMMFANAFVANEISARVAEKLSNVSAWKSDAELKKKINTVIDGLEKDGTLAEINAASIKAILGEKVNIDATMQHPAPVHFTTLGYDLAGAGNGITLTKNGGTIFGNGYIGGKNYLVNVQSVEGSSMQKQKTIRDESQTTNGIGLTENSGVGN